MKILPDTTQVEASDADFFSESAIYCIQTRQSPWRLIAELRTSCQRFLQVELEPWPFWEQTKGCWESSQMATFAGHWKGTQTSGQHSTQNRS